jgi:rhamnogalacturonan acetylesterase
MKSIYLPLSATLAGLSMAVPADRVMEKRATPTVYLAGDSTMAKGGGGTSTQGHLQQFPKYVSN